MSDIEPGYLVKITTWENDADNYNTVEFAGLSDTAVRTLLAIANLFKSENDGKYVNGKWVSSEGMTFGNSNVNSNQHNVTKAIHSVIWNSAIINGWDIPKAWNIMHPEYADWVGDTSDTNVQTEFYHESVHDMIGIWCEGEYYRVFEKAEVFYVPGSIQNVTDQFVNATN